MQYRPLGATGIRVSELCLGAMMFGSFGNPDTAETTRIVHRAIDAGINVVNTADGYSNGESETMLGAALAAVDRDDVVLTVKTGRRVDGRPNEGGGSRRWLEHAIDGSLRRLRTDWIDVYELGVPDPETDLAETLGALTDLVRAGKIRSFGTSKLPPSRHVEARWTSERLGLGAFRTEETPYSMLNRAVEYDLLPTAERLGIGVLAFGALSGGWLSGRYRTGATVAAPGSAIRNRGGRMDADNPANAAKFAAADALGALADGAGLPLVHLATAFALRHPAVSSVVVGPRTVDQLEGTLGAEDLTLSVDLLDAIDAIVPPATTVDVADTMWTIGTDALSPANRRR
jgi:aryl-alcohol dehydrogenase-like predicted oxidoreductase